MPHGRFGIPYWDDLQISVSGARIPPANAPTWRDWDYGTGSGITWPVLGWAVGDLYYLYLQTTHSTKLSELIDLHIHWSIPSDSAGDRFQFQLDVVGAPIGSTWAVLASSPFTQEYTLVGNEANRHNFLDLADFDAINTTVSTVYVVRMERIAATVNEYANEIYMVFNDSHTPRDTEGSITETSKGV